MWRWAICHTIAPAILKHILLMGKKLLCCRPPKIPSGEDIQVYHNVEVQLSTELKVILMAEPQLCTAGHWGGLGKNGHAVIFFWVECPRRPDFWGVPARKWGPALGWVGGGGPLPQGF